MSLLSNIWNAPLPVFATVSFLGPGAIPPDLKNLIGAALILMLVAGSTGLCCLSQRFRDYVFFFMVAAMVLSERMDINFLSHVWYRGTTRGIEIALPDILAMALLASAVLAPRHRPRLFWPASLGLMILFLLYECFSVATSQPQIFGVFEITKTLRAIIFFLAAATFVRSERELRLLALALACTVGLEGVLALKHRFLLHMSRAPGTFESANSLSMYLCMVTPVLVAAANSQWRSKSVRSFALGAIGAAIVAILLTVSRAGIPIFALVVLGATAFTMTWKITVQKLAVTMAACLGVLALTVLSWNSLAARFSGSTLEGETDETKFENRAQYVGLVKAIIQDHFFGVGLNNWSYWVSKKYGRKLGAPYADYDKIPEYMRENPLAYSAGTFAPPAHNLGVITLGELGVPGLALFSLLWLRWFAMGAGFLRKRSPDPMYRMGVGIFFALGGVFLQSLTEWVYRETDIQMTLYILLGALASLYFTKRRARRQARRMAAAPESTIGSY